MGDKEKFIDALTGEEIAKKREKILPNAGTEKQRLEVDKIKNFFDEEGAEYEKISHDFDVYGALMNLTGLKRKDLLRRSFKNFNLEVDNGELNKLDKTSCAKLFFSVFDVYPKLSLDNVTSSGVENSGDEESQAAESETSPRETFCDVSVEQMQTIFNRSNPVETGEIQAADGCTIYKNLPITLKDDFEISVKKTDKIKLFTGLAAIFNSQTNAVAAVGKIEYSYNKSGNYTPHLVFEREKILYSEFERQQRFDIVLVPESEKNFLVGEMTDERAANCKINLYVLKGYSFIYAELKDAGRTLCIDFGTSNTTAGTYGLIGDDDNKINLVTFLDATGEKIIAREILPTMVYVDSCKDSGDIRYKFGYDAKSELMKADYKTEASIFYELKRWINVIDETENIFDKFGNKATVTRAQIIRKYLEYVIMQAEQQFKVHFTKLHFTAPVKLKESFLSIVKKMFPSYKIMNSADSIDEGMAIIYNHIKKRMAKYPPKTGEQSGNILILDCGGGTTDLANCKYSYRQTEIGPSLTIQTNFENGDSNFGGNNVTYRILQLIKIKIAQHFASGENISAKDLIALDSDGKPKDENSILKAIDDDYNSKKDIYAAFEKKYAEAENYVPTKFADITILRDDRSMIKRNFYYLWQMAEAIKIQFYKSDIVNVDFNKLGDREICISSDEQYHLAIRKKIHGEIENYKNPLDDIEITFKEIDLLIKPDIYALLNAMLRLYDTHGDKKSISERLTELSKYSYKLSGQSCKISLFAELLKEFIPGRILRRGRNQSVLKHRSEELKKYCIEGSIEYIRDRTRGMIDPKILEVRPTLMYDVKLESSDEILLSRDEKILVKVLPRSTREARFIVLNERGEVKNQILYNFKVECQDISYPELRRKYIEPQTYFQYEQLDEIYKKLADIDPQKAKYGGQESVLCLFILPSKEGFGFKVYQIFVVNEGDEKIYSVPKSDAAFANYENEQLLTFFDGKF